MRLIFCGMILAFCSTSMQTEVHVEEYGNITLTCSSEDSNSFTLARWYRNNVQICSVLPDCSRSCNPDNNNVTFSCSAGQINNTLLNVTRQNQGDIWRCKLTPGTRNNSFTITVVVPISSVTITKPNGTHLTVIENTEISFVCLTSLGFPSATIKWYKGTTTIDDNMHTSDIKETHSYLIQTISTLAIIPTRTDTDKTIMCTANNTGNIRTSTNKILLDVHYPVSFPTYTANNTPLIGTELKVIVGSQLNVQCVSDGNPSPNLSWKRPDTPIQSVGAIVNFTYVKEIDNGTYICNASNKMLSINETKVSSNSSSLNVIVLVPTTTPLFYVLNDSNNHLIPNNVLFVKRGGKPFTIQCKSSGNPTPVCTLNVSVNNNCVSLFSNVAKDTYINCSTSNVMNTTLSGVKHKRNSSVLSIITMFPPKKPLFKCMNTTLSESTLRVIAKSNITLKCVSESYPLPNYAWERVNDENTPSETLLLTSISVDRHGETLTCIANNTMHVSFGETYYGNNTASIRLDVLYPPTIPLLRVNGVKLNDSINVIRGDNVTMNCSSDGNPSPLHTWHTNGQPTGSSLHLVSIKSNVTRTCEAKNTLQPTCFQHREETSNRSVIILVQYPPENITIEVTSGSDSVKHELNQTHIRVLKGLTFNLSCFAQSYPTPDAIKWKVNNTVETFTQIEFTNATEKHSGIYTCNVVNTMFRTVGPAVNGTGNKSITLLVISTDRPEAPSHFIAVKSSASAITVEWKPGLPGSSPQHFFVSYRTKNSEHWTKENVTDNESESNSKTLRYTIQNLVSDTKYYIQIISQNNFGTSNSTTLIVTTATVVHFNTPLNISAIVGGTIAGMIVLCGSIVLVLFYRRRFWNDKQPERSTDQPITYENLKIEQIPTTQLEYQGETSFTQTSGSNVDHAYEGLSRQDTDKDNQYTQLDNTSNNDAKSTYENLKIQLSSCQTSSGTATDK